MTREAFLEYTRLVWAIEKLEARRSNNDFIFDNEVLAYVKEKMPERYSADRHYQIEYRWETDGINVAYQTTVGGGFGSMEKPHQEWVIFRLKYLDVFGWDVEWSKSAGKLSEVVKTASDMLWAKS